MKPEKMKNNNTKGVSSFLPKLVLQNDVVINEDK